MNAARWLGVSILSVVLAGCADDGPVGGSAGSAGSSGSGGAGGAPAWPLLECDPLVPSHCAYPFPSNVYTTTDAASPTGRRLALSTTTLPKAETGVTSSPDYLNRADGFSPSSALLAHFPGMTNAGLASPNDIGASLEPESPTVLLDAETGERIPHWSELDLSGKDAAQRALVIRPAVRLEDSRRYIVAIRDLNGVDGPIEPGAAFRALRDGEPFAEDPSIDERRALYDDIFDRLATAGVARSNLLLAWDFTTRSKEDITGWLLHMRDEALSITGDDGPTYSIDSVEVDPEPNVAFRVLGRLQVPLYLDQPGPGARLVFGDDGMPEPNATTPTHDVPFRLLIPPTAKTEPVKMLEYGHGLFGENDQIEAGHFKSFMEQYGYAFFATDLVGMSSDDPTHIAEVLTSGQVENISSMYDRLHQGALNYVLLMRTMSRRFVKDPDYGQYLDPTQRYYHGISQGGIFGGVFMAVSPDVERGVLGVMGQPYSLLLNRSVDFTPFFILMGFVFPDSRDQQLLLDLVQIWWDRVEPAGYTKYLREGLPGTPPHEVLMRAAIGDWQVPTLGAHVMARTIGAKHLDSGIRDVWGLSKSSGPITGSAYVEYDFGLPEVPVCNLPMEWCKDPHGKIRDLPEAEQQLDLFLTTGEARNFCAGACSFPAMSGCIPGDTYEDPCMP